MTRESAVHVVGTTDNSNPLTHCFREDSPTEACRDCGCTAEEHEGCDCE